MRLQILAFLCLVMACSTGFAQAGDQAAVLGVKHVVVIGIDGMSPDGIRHAATPFIDQLLQEGASTMQARGVLPSSSSPNWASMIMGAGPEQHGITSNDWERDDFILPAIAGDRGGFFPTIFTLLHDQRPTAEVGAIYHWEGFGRLFDSTDVSFHVAPPSEEATAEIAAQYLKEKKPSFCFIHLDHVDGAGHAKGHGSPAYYQAVSRADTLIGIILEALKAADMAESTLVILTADHGGVGFGHGGESLAELEIPFILWGKGVKKGYQIVGNVNTMDNAVTVAFALNLSVPQAWVGRPVKEAFVGFDSPILTYPTKELLQQPIIHPKKIGFEPAGGLFLDSFPSLNITNPNKMGIIRYTLDGQKPDRHSPVFTNPIKLQKTSIVQAAIFDDQSKRSKEAVAYFRIQHPNRAQGIHYRAFKVAGIDKLPDFNQLKESNSGQTHEFTLDKLVLPQEEQVAVLFTSFLQIDKKGEYQFYLASDDGSQLLLDGQLVVDNDGDHGVLERSGKLTLDRGRHEIMVRWYNGGGGKELFAYFKGPGIPKQLIPPNVLYVNKQ